MINPGRCLLRGNEFNMSEFPIRQCRGRVPEDAAVPAHLARLRIKGELLHKRSTPGQCYNSQLYDHCSKNCFSKARCVIYPGDHGTAACTRNEETDCPHDCVLCNTSGHTADYLKCPRALKIRFHII
ncbi:hypothetical protein EVAR_12370_1 [Eumeta japonica]|uniref:Uncharacterized protein n=1 Tax=Eumeta variegata TaxID=151549 RepID=A0A4C1WZ96_EUMVA|nr:hypothetical protein EVAR_12370_1 [Eumeta japonica]